MSKASLLIFLVGNWTASTHSEAEAGSGQVQTKPTEQLSKSRAEDFVNTGMGEMQSDDGTVFAFTTYRSPDGVTLTALHKEFPSPSRAHEQIAKETNKATKVLERNQVRDTKGRITGERIAAVMPTSDSTRTVQSILWTDGPHFYEIFSTSMQDDLRLEKQMKR